MSSDPHSLIDSPRAWLVVAGAFIASFVAFGVTYTFGVFSSTHGTGCAFATALACGLAQGKELAQAVRGAKDYVRRAILAAYPLGKGTGPINHAG